MSVPWTLAQGFVQVCGVKFYIFLPPKKQECSPARSPHKSPRKPRSTARYCLILVLRVKVLGGGVHRGVHRGGGIAPGIFHSQGSEWLTETNYPLDRLPLLTCQVKANREGHGPLFLTAHCHSVKAALEAKSLHTDWAALSRQLCFPPFLFLYFQEEESASKTIIFIAQVSHGSRSFWRTEWKSSGRAENDVGLGPQQSRGSREGVIRRGSLGEP